MQASLFMKYSIEAKNHFHEESETCLCTPPAFRIEQIHEPLTFYACTAYLTRGSRYQNHNFRSLKIMRHHV